MNRERQTNLLAMMIVDSLRLAHKGQEAWIRIELLGSALQSAARAEQLRGMTSGNQAVRARFESQQKERAGVAAKSPGI